MAPSSPDNLAVRARYTFSLDGTLLQEPLENATLLISSQGATPIDASPDVDLGNVAIIPELVNAHTHLEFSALDAPLPRAPKDSFADWISRVLKWRTERDADSNGHTASVEQGLCESAKHGVGVLGEIATQLEWPSGFSDRHEADVESKITLQKHPMRGVRFFELIGLGAERIENVLATATEFLSSEAPKPWRAGLSPHAPYTVGWKLVESIPSLSKQFKAPVAMHLAETFDEIEFLSSHCGPLVELLQERGVWNPTAVPRGIQPIDYLEKLAEAHRALIIHGNYLVPSDWELLAKHSDTMSVVYCPRTFRYFGHSNYPLRKMLDAGVLVAVGTDSRASNPDLDLFAELRCIRQQHTEVTSREILKLGTENGAKALGFNSLGLRAFDLLNLEVNDPFDLLFGAD